MTTILCYGNSNKEAGELADIIKATPFGAYDNPPALILVVPPSIGKLCEATKLFLMCSVPMERFGEVLQICDRNVAYHGSIL